MKIEAKIDENKRKNGHFIIESEEELAKMGFDHWPTEDEWVRYFRNKIGLGDSGR